MRRRVKAVRVADGGRRLMVVTPYFPPEGGGLEQYTQNVVERLRLQHGWEVVVVTSGGQRFGVVEEEHVHARVYRLPHQARISNTRLGLTWRRDLKRVIATERPALINAHAPVPGLADIVGGVCGDVPLVVTYHAASMRKGRWPIDGFIALYERFICRRLLKRAAWILCSSDFVRDTYLVRYRAKCSTVRPGVDPSLFTPAEVHKADNLLFVGGVGRGDQHKGLEGLLVAVAQVAESHPEVRLDVVGSGNDIERYRQVCRVLGVERRVRFRGRLAGEALADAYGKASLLVLPTRNDSSPLVILEAMASGVPVVSTTVGGIPEMVTDGEEGFLVAPDDAAALSDRIARVLANPVEAQRLGAAGREKVYRHLSWDSQTARTNRIFESILSDEAPAGVRRLAVVTPYFHPKIGGLEQYSLQLARQLNQRPDYEVVILTSNHRRRRTKVEVLDGLTVFRFPAWARISNTPVSPLWPRQLRRALADNRVELVNVHTPVPFMAEAAALACEKNRLVLTYHAGSMRKDGGVANIAIGLYERWVLPRLISRAEAVISVSEAVSGWFSREFACDSTVISPAVDDGLFCPGSETGTPSTQSLLFVGRIERSSAWKGIDCLLQAFALLLRRCPDAKLVLVGDGDACEDHRRTVDRLGIGANVSFRGALRGEELVAAYRRASAAVLPSTADAESFGMSLIEAMACGTPVVGSRVGGIPSVIRDCEDGLLVPPQDPERLAEACLRLLENPSLARWMGQQACRRVRAHYTWPARVDAYHSVFAGEGVR